MDSLALRRRVCNPLYQPDQTNCNVGASIKSMEIEDHYSQLLGIRVTWEISKVDLDISAHRADIEIEYTDVTGACPECGASCPRHDDRKQRSWRHLDTMQFATYLHCSVP